MNKWNFFEIIKPEAIKALKDYQQKHYHTELDKPLLLWNPSIKTPDEVGKGIKRKPSGMVRVA